MTYRTVEEIKVTLRYALNNQRNQTTQKRRFS
jgi:hypothetical protein